MGDFQTSPGYEFAFSEGQRAVQSLAAKDGMLRSGATAKALQQRGQNLAALDFQSYYNRLSSLAGLGQNAAAGVGNQGIQTGQGIAQTAASAGTAQANIYGNAAQGLGNAANSYANNSMYQQAIQQQQPNALGPQAGNINSGNFSQGVGGYDGAGPYLNAAAPASRGWW